MNFFFRRYSTKMKWNDFQKVGLERIWHYTSTYCILFIGIKGYLSNCLPIFIGGMIGPIYTRNNEIYSRYVKTQLFNFTTTHYSVINVKIILTSTNEWQHISSIQGVLIWVGARGANTNRTYWNKSELSIQLFVWISLEGVTKLWN